MFAQVGQLEYAGNWLGADYHANIEASAVNTSRAQND